MSSTVNLFDHLLDTACRLHQAGRHNDAFAYLCKLIKLPDLPADIAAEAHLRLAEILLRRRKPTRARKHLKAALRHAPDDARAQQLMAEALEEGRLPDPCAALEHYRRSLELAPDQPECLCAAGRLAVAQGLGEEGLGYLRKAAEVAADDPDVLRQIVDGMLLANQADEARGLVRAAMFRRSGDRRFRGLWEHLQFQALRQQQGEARARRTNDADTEPVLLPFAAPAEGRVTRRKVKVARVDGPSALAGPHPVVISRPRFAR
jgi:Tfp pilus assembly protein PilF